MHNQPGFNAPLATSGPTIYPSLEEGFLFTLLTLREVEMMRAMNEITDKPDWETKVFDEQISTKWTEELMTRETQPFTKQMVDYTIAEVQYKTNLYRKTAMISVFDSGVVKNDIAVSETLRGQLITAAASLEDVRDLHQDWHPGSDGKVLNLVHPSMYPLVYGRSRILADSTVGVEDCIAKCGLGTRLIRPRHLDQVPVSDSEAPGSEGDGPEDNGGGMYSRDFQWLPSNVLLEGDNFVRIASYVNNLHPYHHKSMYPIIEELVNLAIPMWDLTLELSLHNKFAFESKGTTRRIECKGCMGYVKERNDFASDEQPAQRENEADQAFCSRQGEWWDSVKQYILPEPDPFNAPPDLTDSDTFHNLRQSYRDNGIQVITKVANIQLTPEKPEYDGSNWHVEGQMNEHIIATALYYYDSENITTSRLSFRQSSMVDEMTIEYEQDDHDWLPLTFGAENEEDMVQDLGSVACTQGRMVTFPNTLQHRVEPFGLLDRSKPGHRKIVALFLVDPTIRIISTANVPAQRKDWWLERVWQTRALPGLSMELQEKIVHDVEGFPFSLDEAREFRRRLMAERGTFVRTQDSHFRYDTFTLCEH